VYEPQRECHAIIEKRLSGLEHIRIWSDAVYHTSGETLRMVSHTNYDSGTVARDTDAIEIKEWAPDVVVEDEVATVSLEDVSKRAAGSIDYKKIDCETSQYNFLMRKDLSAIRYLGIELSWQIGLERWNSLVAHIQQWFQLAEGSVNYKPGYNI